MSIYKNFCRETFDEKGRPVNVKISCPDNFNFGYDVVDVLAAEAPDKRALVWCNTEGGERIFTFGDVSRLSNKAANVFLGAGIGRGDTVIVALKRHYEYWFVSVALHKIGAVMVPVTHMLTADDLAYRMKSAGVRGVVCTPENGVPGRMLEAASRECPDCAMWTVRESAGSFQNLTEAMEAAPDTLRRRPTAARDPMVLYFTSGTTGYPKGVIHDFTYPLAHIVTAKYWQQAEEGGLHFTVAETGWAKASWGKIYGQWLAGCAVMVFDFDAFDPRRLVAVINRYGVTSFCAPPTVYRYLVRGRIPGMPSLRHASTAGELLNPEVSRRFTEQTGLPLMEGYGQTETTLLIANFKGGEWEAGSMGTPSPFYNVELRSVDGSPTPDGEVGEIVVVPPENSPQPGLFARYLDNEELYREVWRGGVYHTGDAARRDVGGNYWFHGRFDDIIKSGGYRIGPFEVENILMQHPAVLECGVIGVPDELRGQAVKAVIVLSPGYEATRELEADIRGFCNSRMSEYKWIRLIEFAEAMPKTISGKIRRIDLKK